MRRSKIFVRGRAFLFSTSSSSDEDCEPLSCRHCGVRRFSTNASRRRHERACEMAPATPLSREAGSNAAENETVSVGFENGPLGFELDGPDLRTLTKIFEPEHSRSATQGSANEQAASQLRVGWTLMQVNGRRVRPERDLITSQIKLASRPVVLTWRTNGITPPPCNQQPTEPTPQGCRAQQGLSLLNFDEARRSLRRTLSSSSHGSPIPPMPQSPPSVDEFATVVETLRKSLSKELKV